MQRIKKNDTVKVIAGNDKGKEGRVLAVYPTKNRLIIEGINMIKRHTRPTQDNPKGGIIEKEAPIDLSNVALVFEGKVTKVGYKKLNDGKKVRVSKKTGELIDSI
ncbi:MAG: 50S ribosomal protein L24 [Candidatus Marinimicrobia bacterium]|nr:50S ribosomal protein L24 [Candidatus Neomarinimicrobiota bacterium]